MKRFSGASILLSMSVSLSCHSQAQKEISKNGFLNSPSFSEYLSHYDIRAEIIQSDKNIFSLLGEEEFLYNSDFDSYIIYLYFPNSKSWQCYSIKYRDNQAIASFKDMGELKNDSQGNQLFSKGVFRKKIISENEIQTFQNKLNEASEKIKATAPKNSNGPYRMIMYFDGKEYYRLSDQQLDENTLNDLDLFFRNSPVFQE